MKQKYSGFVSIISGKFKGKKIYIKNIECLRPTLSRIKETIFNWLNDYIINANCLDCFAGSGSLSIECISRYAKFCTIIDNNIIMINCIKKILLNINSINISELININILKWIKNYKKHIKYDVIFLDPPFFNIILINEVIYLLEHNNYIFKKKTFIYLEIDKMNYNKIKIPLNWYLHKNKIYNNIIVSIYIREN